MNACAGATLAHDAHPHLHLVQGMADGADVVSIESAPSARRRKGVLRQDDPATRRHPACRHQSVVVQSTMSIGHVVRGVCATLALSVVAGLAGFALAPDVYSGPTIEHAVTGGESVWSLAQGVDTDRNLEDVVTDIQRLNGIEGGLQVGQKVILPLN